MEDPPKSIHRFGHEVATLEGFQGANGNDHYNEYHDVRLENAFVGHSGNGAVGRKPGRHGDADLRRSVEAELERSGAAARVDRGVVSSGGRHSPYDELGQVAVSVRGELHQNSASAGRAHRNLACALS